MTFEVQQNRWDQLIRRVGASIGPGSRVSESLSELFPVLDVERVPGELLLLGQTQLCFGSIGVTGGAGETGRAQLFNPVDSGKLITVSSLSMSTTVITILRVATTAIALLTGVGTEKFRDARLGQTQRPTGQIRTESTAALTDANVQIRTVANRLVTLDDLNSVAVLPPGTGLEVGPNTNSIQVNSNFFWRERVAEASELIQ